jgi:hypothetical protein
MRLHVPMRAVHRDARLKGLADVGMDNDRT